MIYLCKIKARNEGGSVMLEPEFPVSFVLPNGARVRPLIARNADQTLKFNWGLVIFEGVTDFSELDALADYYNLSELPLETVLNNGQKNAIQNKLDTFGITMDVAGAITLGDVIELIKAEMIS